MNYVNSYNEIILLKQGELVLKGLNRGRFEARLIANIKRRLRQIGEFDTRSAQSTIYVEPVGEQDMDAAYSALSKVFGVAAMSRAAVCEKNIDEIIKAAKEYLKDELSSASSFKVESRRADKSFSMTSPELSAEAGGALLEAFPHLRVDVRSPEALVFIEVRESAAYVHMASKPGAGGLPVGTGGRAAVLLSGGIDSPVAAHMIAKRGIELIAVHFFSYPYTSERAREKVVTLRELLSAYCGRMPLFVVPFTRIQEQIRASCDEDYFTLIMRRFMMRISEKIARENGCSALVTGESLAQVASQTLDALHVTGSACMVPVLRPVIGMDKEEIVTLARRIGTFETSILPYEDCCTVFTPKHPKTKPRLENVLRIESALDIEVLENEAVLSAELLKG